jgi:hypothetical protein
MLKGYMSHPIRGPLKDKATPEQIRANCDMAKEVAMRIRYYMDFNHPDIDLDLYVPAEHESFVLRAFRNDMLTVQQILHIDCQIIEEDYNGVLLVFAPYGPPVEGCSIELKHAVKCGIAVLVFKDMSAFKEQIEIFLEGYDEC